MSAIALHPRISANDRLGMTLFVSIMVHAMLILGVNFVNLPALQNNFASLEVILVNTQSPSIPNKADYLAQVSQDGGGNSDRKLRPTDMFSAPTLSQQPGMAMQQTRRQQNHIRHQAEQALLAIRQAKHSIQKEDKNRRKDIKNIPVDPAPNTMVAARLVEELSLTYEKNAQKPREKFITSRTREYAAATYMRNWVDKIERLGNADYPDEAIRNRLSGTLILDVAIKADGTLHAMELRQSSGHKILDDAAKRIVRMATPFDPFPANLRKQTDILHITRSWEFLSNNELRSY
jgi:protein TonB